MYTNNSLQHLNPKQLGMSKVNLSVVFCAHSLKYKSYLECTLVGQEQQHNFKIPII